jgi:ABC-type uncharacterized transport system substrate-binding protein
VSLGVQAIVTAGTPPVKALKNATRNIPIIIIRIGDTVAAGPVESLAHPGGTHQKTGNAVVDAVEVLPICTIVTPQLLTVF